MNSNYKHEYKKEQVNIEIANLSFSYETEILKKISTEFANGKFYTIIGPNGSGKTTLLRLLSKVLIPQSGNVLIDGVDIKNITLKNIAKKISVVPQDTVIEFDFTVQDIVLMGRAPHISRFASETEDDIAAAENAMELTNIAHLREKNINNLSGGERQRVVTARAIAQATDCILLDEPISHLDIHHQIEILNVIKSLCNTSGKTVIAVLHDLNLATEYSDKIILMHDGDIHSVGSPEEIIVKSSIEEVYGVQVSVIESPVSGKPHVIPII